MGKTIYSHAFLVGCFSRTVIPQDLSKEWNLKKLTQDEYNFRLSQYYKSHVDAMTEAVGQEKPSFLNDVHHYCVSFQ